MPSKKTNKIQGKSLKAIRNKAQGIRFQLLILLSFAFCLSTSAIFSQTDTTEQNLFIIARPLADSIMLRWAPATYKYWDLGNRYGFRLVRYTVMKDSSLLSEPQIKELTPSGIKPLPLNDWEQLVKTNKYGGVAAQAIYGESFNVDAGEGTNPQKVVYKAKEQKQRFSFALYAADISPEVAAASGLWFTDNTAKKDEMYLYRVYLNLPDSLAAINDTAFVFTGIRSHTPLPKPVELSAEFGDRTAVLSWNSFSQNNIYIAWDVERSDNGRNFQALTIDPQVSVMPSENANPEYTYKYDSLPQNGKEYFYRIRGISSFGERGPWSDATSGKGLEAIKATPNITGHEIIGDKVLLKWEFPSGMESTVSGFKVLRSSNHQTGFVALKAKLKPSDRSFTDKKPLGTNYYKLIAYRDSAAPKASFPYLVQLTDNTPPVKPKGLSGRVDSSGTVRLHWQANPDEDIYGYRVFRSASGNDEFSLRTSRPVADTFFVDTLNKKDLNASVFYKIVAIDLRQNQSEFSAVAELVKPDDTPPSIPVVTQTRATDEGVQLTWINSTSADVSKHVVYRWVQGDSSWAELAEIPYKKGSRESAYTDRECSTAKTSRYKITAVDKSGNASEPSLSIAVQGLRNTKRPGLQKINKETDYEKGKIYLSWQLPESPLKRIKIYRKTDEKGYSLFETLDGDKTVFEDYGMKVGNFYAYRLKLIYTDGSISGFSDEIKIEY